MTQPDLYFPASAINYDSIAELAAKTAEDIEAELHARVSLPFENVVDGLFGGLSDGLQSGVKFAHALLTEVARMILSVPEAVFDTIEDIAAAVWAFLTGRWAAVDSAQSSANYALAQLAAANRPIFDLFDGAAGTISSDWALTYFDDGGGAPQQNGAGELLWLPFGGIARGVRARWAALDTITDNQVISTVLSVPPGSPNNGGTPHLSLRGRVNSADDTCVWARHRYNTVAVGATVEGSAATFASRSISRNPGDAWDFHIGTDDDPYEFALLKNGVSVFDSPIVDTSELSQLGVEFRSVGYEMYAADADYGVSQTVPGRMAVISADDRIEGGS